VTRTGILRRALPWIVAAAALASFVVAFELWTSSQERAFGCAYYSPILPWTTSCEAGDLPAVTSNLAPGSYSFLVRSVSESGTTPFAGDWELSSGTAYSNCFYITQTFG
jgi:hypothetical protein